MDGRSASAAKRKIDQLERDQALLHNLLGLIRTSTDHQLGQIVSVIRSDASLQEVKNILLQQISQVSEHHNIPGIDVHRPLLATRYLGDEEHHASASMPSSTHQDTMQNHRLVDTPLHNVPAQPWTMVTDDVELVSNLISVWLTWDKPFTNFLDHTLFLRDMKSQQTDAKYCSPMLVNAILAWACPYSDYDEARSANGNFSFLMTSFFVTAKSLQGQELQQKPRLTTVQALLYIALVYFMQGQERHAYRSLLRASNMVQELVQSETGLRRSMSIEEEQIYSMAIDVTAWGLFNIATSVSIGYMKVPLMEQPTRRRPSPNSTNFQDDLWTPYPLDGPVVASPVAGLFDLFCDISIVSARIFQILFGNEEDGTAPRDTALGQALELWEVIESRVAQIPENLKVSANASGAVHVYQFYIQGLKIRLFSYVQRRCQSPMDPLHEFARKKCVDAALEMAQIYHVFVGAYSPLASHSSFAFVSVLAVCTLLGQQGPLQYSAEILDLCSCLKSVVKRWPNTAGLLRFVRVDATRSGTVFSPEIEKLFEEFDHEWATARFRIVSDLFPSPAAATDLTGGPEIINMASFMERMGQLDLSVIQMDDDND